MLQALQQLTPACHGLGFPGFALVDKVPDDAFLSGWLGTEALAPLRRAKLLGQRDLDVSSTPRDATGTHRHLVSDRPAPSPQVGGG